MKYRLLFFLCLLSFNSCRLDIDKKLDRLELEIEHSPDSALSHLERIPQRQLHSQSVSARYALLKSMAFDKSYIDITDDSLINIAVNYYSKSRRQPKYRMLAYYYDGLIQKNATNYPAAIISLEYAADLANGQKDLRYLGLSYRNIADIYYLSNNMAAAADYHKKAIDAFRQNRDTAYVQYALFSLAVDLMNDFRYNESRKILKDLISTADNNLTVDSELCYAQICVELEDSVYRAIDIYRKVPLAYYNFLDYGYRSQAYVIVGQLDSADYWIQQGFKMAENNREKATLDFLQADIDHASNRHDLAFKHIKRAAIVQDSLTRALLHQSLSIAQRDYYMQDAALQRIRLKQQKTMIFVWSFTALVFVFLLFIYFREKNIREERLLKDTIAHLELQKNLSGKASADLVGTLFLEKYAHLGDLVSCFGEGSSKRDLVTFKKDLSGLYDNESAFLELYKMLNYYLGDIILKFSQQVPSVSKDNMKTIALFFAGVPDELIQYIVKKQSVGSIKTYRSRLRKDIKEAGCDNEKLFLTYLERQPQKKTKI